jgi:hypothetical protein
MEVEELANDFLEKGSRSAFASVISMDDGGIYVQRGLTKREYFAAAALNGILASPHTYSDAVMKAVMVADSLINELEKRNNNGKESA